MKVLPSIILSAAFLVGCGHQDPIDRLVNKVSHESVPSYIFRPINLPATATPKELIAAIYKRGVVYSPGFAFATYEIVEVREVQIEPPRRKFTAVLLDTDLGQKIVLLQPLGNETNWHGWYYRTYDAK